MAGFSYVPPVDSIIDPSVRFLELVLEVSICWSSRAGTAEGHSGSRSTQLPRILIASIISTITRNEQCLIETAATIPFVFFLPAKTWLAWVSTACSCSCHGNCQELSICRTFLKENFQSKDHHQLDFHKKFPRSIELMSSDLKVLHIS